jgi:hypothetical protein
MGACLNQNRVFQGRLNNIPTGKKIGVIAAGTGMRFGFNPFIPGDNDDLIAVFEMRFNGMHDFILRKFWPHQAVHKNKKTVHPEFAYI